MSDFTIEELREMIHYYKDPMKRVGLDELLLLLAEYIGDKDVMDQVDQFEDDLQQIFTRYEIMERKFKEIYKNPIIKEIVDEDNK